MLATTCKDNPFEWDKHIRKVCMAYNSEFAIRLKSTLEQAYPLCRDKANLTHRRQKEFYDQRIHGNPFQQGDLVWLHSPVKSGSQYDAGASVASQASPAKTGVPVHKLAFASVGGVVEGVSEGGSL